MASTPRTLTYDSCSPANEAPAESSPGADERTTVATSAKRAASGSASAARTSSGSGVVEKQVADAQGRVPELLPAHLGEVLALELEEDAHAQPGGVEVGLVGVGGDGHERRHGDPGACHARQGQRLAADARRRALVDLRLRG